MTLKWFLFSVIIVSVSLPRINCQAEGETSTAISTSVSNSLSSIFKNIWAVKWRTLEAIRDVLADTGALGLNVVGEGSKGVSRTIDLASSGLGTAKDYTVQGLEYTTSTIQSGAKTVSNAFDGLANQAQLYAKQWSREPSEATS